MNLEQREEIKKKILILAVKSELALTANEVSEKIGISYPTACNLLFELALEGHLKLKTKGWTRYFKPVIELKQGLDIIKR